MPDGELPPNGLPAQIVEFWADIYTEAVKPLYPQMVVALVVLITCRFLWRRRQRRHATPVSGVPAVARDGPD